MKEDHLQPCGRMKKTAAKFHERINFSVMKGAEVLTIDSLTKSKQFSSVASSCVKFNLYEVYWRGREQKRVSKFEYENEQWLPKSKGS
jgi:hypothetical protein